MDLQELLENSLKHSKYQGTYSLADLLTHAASRQLNAVAVAKEGNSKYYLAFLNGEPEGALYVDADGALFGDKAVVHIRGGRDYVLCDAKPDVIDALVMGCRIFEKEHIRKNIMYMVPEIGRKSQGIGVVTLSVRREKKPQNGVRVSSQERRKDCGKRHHYRERGGQFPCDAR